MNDNTHTDFQIKNTTLVYWVLTYVVWIIVCILLYVIGLLSVSILEVISIIGVLLAVIGVTWKASVSRLNLSKRFYIKVVLASTVTILIVTSGVIYFSNNLETGLPNTSGGGGESSTLANSTSTASVYSLSTIPFCSINSDELWIIPHSGTYLSCTKTGLIMGQNSAQSFAEVLLDQSDFYGDFAYTSGSYGVSVNASFQTPNDTKTWAGVIVQSPEEYDIAGGYIFMLNSVGQWQLQHILGQGSTLVIAGGFVKVNSKKLITIGVEINNGRLYSFVNGKQVLTWRDDLDTTSKLTGIIVSRTGGLSSSVIYSNFSLLSFN